MSWHLDLDSVEKKLKRVKKRKDTDIQLPDGIEKSEFDDFMRIMKAVTPAEIEDIPLSRRLDLYEKVDELTKVIDFKTIFTDGDSLLSKMEHMKSAPAVRRVL